MNVYKKRWQEELRERLLKIEKKKRKQAIINNEEEQRFEENNKPRSWNAEVTKQEFFDKISKLYRSFTDILTLSPMDYLLLEAWWEEGINLKVVIRAMEELIRKYHIKHGKEVKVWKLEYFKQAVECAWEDHKESLIGAH